MKYIIQEVKEPNIKFKIKKQKYYGYSKKKLEKIYPNDEYTLIGEIKTECDRKKIGELDNGEAISKLDTYSRIVNKEKGYLCVGKDTYVLVLRRRFLIPILFGIALILLLLCKCNKEPDGPIVINPDSYIEDITPIEDDDSIKPEVDKGDGSVTLIWTLEAEASLSSKKVNVYFKNPNASTHDIKVELYVISDGKEIVIAESDIVKAGYSLNKMNMVDNVVLSKGIYNGTYRVTGYDPVTGEPAAYLPQIPNVVIKVLN